MKKTYVLDTNIVLHNPQSIMSFEDNIVILPDIVIDELDNKKYGTGEIPANARAAARILKKMIEDQDNGNLLSGYRLSNGGILRIAITEETKSIPIACTQNNDYHILQICKALKEKNGDVVLVSNDSFIRIKAALLGIKAEEFTTERAPVVSEQYTGRRIGYATTNIINKIYSEGIHPDDIMYYDEDGLEVELPPLVLHEYIIVKSVDGQSSALTYFNGDKIIPLEDTYKRVGNITPNNVAQRLALHAIKSDKPLVIIKGPAGTGKTLLAIAAGLDAVEKKQYKRILYLRGNIKLDEDIGFLPGTEEEKLNWVLRPVKDNLEVIFGNTKDDFSSATKTRKGAKKYNTKYDEENDDKSFITDEMALQDKIMEIFSRDIIRIEAVGHMRGRSIANTLVIIDEAQNLTPKQIRTLLTRSSKATKVILLGDPAQIDHQYLDARTNGLSVASQRMAGSATTIQTTFFDDECERSELSEEVARRMGDK